HPTQFYTLSLHDALPISSESGRAMFPFPEIGRTLATNTVAGARAMVARAESYERVPDMGHSRKYSTVSPPCRNKSVRNRPALARSEEHTSELQSPDHLVC